MKVQLSFDEIKTGIENRLNQSIGLEPIDTHTVGVVYNAGPIPIKIGLTVKSVSGNAIVMVYRFHGFMPAFLQNRAIDMLKGFIPIHIVEINTDDKTVVVYLDQIEKLEKVLKVVEPKDIRFDNAGIEVAMGLV